MYILEVGYSDYLWYNVLENKLLWIIIILYTSQDVSEVG